MELQPFKPAEELVHKPLGMVDQTNHLETFLSMPSVPDYVTGNRLQS